MQSAAGPFSSMRVLDLSAGIAGAYATKLLVDLGADATIVEPPGGAALRRRDPGPPGRARPAESPLWRHLRASTHSVVVDDPADPEALASLVARTDIVIEDLQPGSEQRRRAAPDSWIRRHDDLILVSITPYGTEGPEADRPATGFTVEVDAGSVDRRGLPPRPPITVGGDLVDWLAGTFAAAGALTASRHRVRCGRGQHVDVSMLEAAVLCLNGPYRVMSAQWFPGVPMPRAIEVPSIEPALDGPVGFCTQTAQQWSDFCALIGRSDLALDPRLNRADERMTEIVEIRDAIADFCLDRTVDDVVELAAAMRIPVTPVGTGATVWAFDQLAERGVYALDADGLRRPRPPYRFSSSTLRPLGPAPQLGSHTCGAGDVDARAEEFLHLAVTSPMSEGRPFDGLRLVDLTAFWAGPIATQYLGALGAEVIKVESIQRPDGIRFLGSFDLESPWERSFVFAGVNTGKLDVTLDLSVPEGRALLDRLLVEADVLIENFTPRVLANFGLEWEDLHERFPRLVLVRMPAFGLDGPWRDRAGFAMTIEQTSGLAWTTGYPDLPVVPRGPCDPVGGMHAVVALIAALADRDNSGAGQLVEVPLLEVACNIAAEAVLEHSATGFVLDRSVPPVIVPQALVPCAGEDEWLGVAAVDDRQWRSLCTAIGIADATLVEADLAARRSRADEIESLIAEWARSRSAGDAERSLLDAGVPAAVMRRSGEIVDHPQIVARQVLQPFDHPVTGSAGYPNFPMRFSAFGPHLLGPRPPLLGEHNHEILGRLGVDPDDIADLERRGVIGTRPSWL